MIGKVLTNGARVLDYSNTRLLAFAPDQSPIHPFVIWYYDVTDEGITPYSGNYFDSIISAMEAWNPR